MKYFKKSEMNEGDKNEQNIDIEGQSEGEK